MVTRRSPAALGSLLAVALVLAVLPAAPSASASAHDGAPPIVPVDVRSDPPLENITSETDEVPFTIELGLIEEAYTGEYRVELSIEDEHIATVEDIWPPDTDRLNVTTDEDADSGAGTWVPSIGEHAFNLTVEADGNELPLSFPLRIGPDPATTGSMPTHGADTSPIQLEPSSPTAGEDVTVHVNVTNRGSWATPADEPLPVRLTLDNETLATQTIDEPLASYNATTVTFEDVWTAETGTHALEATVDASAIEEITAENNAYSLERTIRQTAVTVDDLTATPDPAPADESITVQATIVNEEDEAAPETVTALYLDEEPVADADTPTLDPGERANVTWEIEAEPGVPTLRAVPDAEDAPTPPPRDEATAAIRPSVGPDLALLEADTEPDPALEGDNVTLTATLENRGAAVEDEVSIVVHDADTDERRANTTIDGLDAGNTTELAVELEATPGEHTLAVSVDPDDAIAEANEGNNQAVTGLYVRKEIPELAIAELALADASPLPGQTVPAEAILVNEDDTNHSGLAARFNVDGRQLGETITVDELDPGAAERLTSWDWEVEPGEHILELHVGTPTDLRREEPLETATASIEVEDVHPDVVVDGFTLEPSRPSPGEQARLAVDIANRGQAPATGLTVAFELDGERLGIERVDELAPGNSTTLLGPSWEVDGNESEAKVIVDPDGEVHAEDSGERQATLAVDPAQANASAPGLLLGLAGVLLAALGCRTEFA